MANSAGLTSVIVNFTTAGPVIKPAIMVMEFCGAALSSLTDGSVNNKSGASFTTSTRGALTTTHASHILVFATDTAGNEAGWPAGAGYTIPNNQLNMGASGSNIRMAMQHVLVSAAQTKTTASMTYAGSNCNGNIFAAFK